LVRVDERGQIGGYADESHALEIRGDHPYLREQRVDSGPGGLALQDAEHRFQDAHGGCQMW
jgi:hypothetical protein